jgi:hypothetical protein
MPTPETTNILTPEQIELVNEARKQLLENPDSYIDWEVARLQLFAVMEE